MRILILEDSEERVKQFFLMFGDDHSLVVVNSAADAISLATTSKFSVIFLDHDLGGKTFVDSNEENTGYQVAKILPTSINKTTPIIIHSWNGPGVKRMKRALETHEAQVVDIIFGNFGKDILKE